VWELSENKAPKQSSSTRCCRPVSLSPSPSPSPHPPPSHPNHLPPVSRFFFFFVDPIITYGYKHTLELENVWKPHAVDTKPLYADFDKEWQKQRRRAQPDIKRAVIANSTGALIYTGLLYLLSMAAQLVGPLMLQRIVSGLGCWAKQGGVKGGACPPDRDLY